MSTFKDLRFIENRKINERHMEECEFKIKNLNSDLKNAILKLWTEVKDSVFKDNMALKIFINKEASELSLYHFGLGTYLRNTFLYPNEGFCQQFVENGISHYDEMSCIIIRIFHCALRDGTLIL